MSENQQSTPMETVNILSDIPTNYGAEQDNIPATQLQSIEKDISLQIPTGPSLVDDIATLDYYDDPVVDVLITEVSDDLNLDLAEYLAVDYRWRSIADQLHISTKKQRYIESLTKYNGCSWQNFVDKNPMKDCLTLRMLFLTMHDLHPKFVDVLAYFQNDKDIVGYLGKREADMRTASSSCDQTCDVNDQSTVLHTDITCIDHCSEYNNIPGSQKVNAVPIRPGQRQLDRIESERYEKAMDTDVKKSQDNPQKCYTRSESAHKPKPARRVSTSKTCSMDMYPRQCRDVSLGVRVFITYGKTHGRELSELVRLGRCLLMNKFRPKFDLQHTPSNPICSRDPRINSKPWICNQFRKADFVLVLINDSYSKALHEANDTSLNTKHIYELMQRECKKIGNRRFIPVVMAPNLAITPIQLWQLDDIRTWMPTSGVARYTHVWPSSARDLLFFMENIQNRNDHATPHNILALARRWFNSLTSEHLCIR